jgi:hypothetical protein
MDVAAIVTRRKVSARFQAEGQRLLDQLITNSSLYKTIYSYLVEAGEDREAQQIIYICDRLDEHEAHMVKLLAEEDKHEPGHVWAELNRTRNQLIYQMVDAQQLFLRYVYLFKTTLEGKK